MEKTYLTLSFKSRIELYILKIKIGSFDRSKLRIAIEEFPKIFKKEKLGCLYG